MKPLKIVPIIAFIASMIVTVAPSVSFADEGVTLKPGNGMSFVVGTKRATTYFHPKSGECYLTLMIGEADAVVGKEYLSAARLKIKISPNDVTRIDSFKGQSLSIVCNKAAESITVFDERLKLTSLTK